MESAAISGRDATKLCHGNISVRIPRNLPSPASRTARSKSSQWAGLTCHKECCFLQLWGRGSGSSMWASCRSPLRRRFRLCYIVPWAQAGALWVCRQFFSEFSISPLLGRLLNGCQTDGHRNGKFGNKKKGNLGKSLASMYEAQSEDCCQCNRCWNHDVSSVPFHLKQKWKIENCRHYYRYHFLSSSHFIPKCECENICFQERRKQQTFGER